MLCIIWCMSGASSGVCLGHHLGQYVKNVVLHASVMPFYFLCMSNYLMGLIQGHAAEPDQPDPDWDRSGRPAHDARVPPLRRPHVPAQIPGLKVDRFCNNVFYPFSSTGPTRRSIHVHGAFSCFSTATFQFTFTQCQFGTHFRWGTPPIYNHDILKT